MSSDALTMQALLLVSSFRDEPRCTLLDSPALVSVLNIIYSTVVPNCLPVPHAALPPCSAEFGNGTCANAAPAEVHKHLKETRV